MKGVPVSAAGIPSCIAIVHNCSRERSEGTPGDLGTDIDAMVH